MYSQESQQGNVRFNAKSLKESDLFYVGILDHKLPLDKLSISLEKEVKKVITDQLFYRKEDPVEDAVTLISNEINKYVWNK